MHNSGTENLKSFLIFVVCGLVYQNKFSERKDWLDVRKIFQPESVTDYFLKNAVMEGDFFKISHQAIPPEVAKASLYNILDCFGAVGSSRVQRIVSEKDIAFEVAQKDIEKFYLYPFIVDYGVYGKLPPYLGMLLHPWRDFFTLKAIDYIENDNCMDLKQCDVYFEDSSLKCSSLEISFGNFFREVSVVTLDFEINKKIKISFISRVIEFEMNGDTISFSFDEVVNSVDKFSQFIEKNL